MRPSLLQTHAQTNIKGQLQIKRLICLNLGELLPSKLASLCIEELTVSLSCLTAARRRHKKKGKSVNKQVSTRKMPNKFVHKSGKHKHPISSVHIMFVPGMHTSSSNSWCVSVANPNPAGAITPQGANYKCEILVTIQRELLVV